MLQHIQIIHLHSIADDCQMRYSPKIPNFISELKCLYPDVFQVIEESNWNHKFLEIILYQFWKSANREKQFNMCIVFLKCAKHPRSFKNWIMQLKKSPNKNFTILSFRELFCSPEPQNIQIFCVIRFQILAGREVSNLRLSRSPTFLVPGFL